MMKKVKKINDVLVDENVNKSLDDDIITTLRNGYPISIVSGSGLSSFSSSSPSSSAIASIESSVFLITEKIYQEEKERKQKQMEAEARKKKGKKQAISGATEEAKLKEQQQQQKKRKRINQSENDDEEEDNDKADDSDGDSEDNDNSSDSANDSQKKNNINNNEKEIKSDLSKKQNEDDESEKDTRIKQRDQIFVEVWSNGICISKALSIQADEFFKRVSHDERMIPSHLSRLSKRKEKAKNKNLSLPPNVGEDCEEIWWNFAMSKIGQQKLLHIGNGLQKKLPRCVREMDVNLLSIWNDELKGESTFQYLAAFAGKPKLKQISNSGNEKKRGRKSASASNENNNEEGDSGKAQSGNKDQEGIENESMKKPQKKKQKKQNGSSTSTRNKLYYLYHNRSRFSRRFPPGVTGMITPVFVEKYKNDENNNGESNSDQDEEGTAAANDNTFNLHHSKNDGVLSVTILHAQDSDFLLSCMTCDMEITEHPMFPFLRIWHCSLRRGESLIIPDGAMTAIRCVDGNKTCLAYVHGSTFPRLQINQFVRGMMMAGKDVLAEEESKARNYDDDSDDDGYPKAEIIFTKRKFSQISPTLTNPEQMILTIPDYQSVLWNAALALTTEVEYYTTMIEKVNNDNAKSTSSARSNNSLSLVPRNEDLEKLQKHDSFVFHALLCVRQAVAEILVAGKSVEYDKVKGWSGLLADIDSLLQYRLELNKKIAQDWKKRRDTLSKNI